LRRPRSEFAEETRRIDDLGQLRAGKFPAQADAAVCEAVADRCQAHLLQAHPNGAFLAGNAESRATQRGRRSTSVGAEENGIRTIRIVVGGQLDREIAVMRVSPLAVIWALRPPGTKGGATQFFGQFGTVHGAHAGIAMRWFVNVPDAAPMGGLPQPMLFFPVRPLAGSAPIGPLASPASATPSLPRSSGRAHTGGEHQAEQNSGRRLKARHESLDVR
jgi:hypothetical protein